MLDRAVHVLRLRWRSLTRRREVETQLADEIAYHLAEEADRREARGDVPAAAAEAALRAFGGVDQTKEACRDARGTVLVESIVKDLRYGARSLLRQPAYAVPAVLTIALGIGATTAVFALVDGILVTRLPYPAPERLVAANAVYPGGGRPRRVARCPRWTSPRTPTVTCPGDRRRPGGARHRRARVRRAVRRPRRHAGPRPDLPRRRGSGGPRRCRAPERRALAHALRGRPRRRRPVDRRRRPLREIVGVLPASVDLRRGGRRFGYRWRSIRGTPRATGPATSCRCRAPPARRHRGEGPGRTAAVPARRAPAVPVDHADEWNRDLVVVPLQTALVGGVASRLGILSAAALVVLVIACATSPT